MEQFYRYFVGVGIEDIRSPNYGKHYMDFFIEITPQEYDESIVTILNNRIMEDPKCKMNEDNVNMMLRSLQGISLRTKAQNLICLNFHSDIQWTRQDMEAYILTTSIQDLKKAQCRI